MFEQEVAITPSPGSSILQLPHYPQLSIPTANSTSAEKYRKKLGESALITAEENSQEL